MLLLQKIKSMIQSPTLNSIKTLSVTSKVFDEGGAIPKRYTCDGLNVNPPLDIAFIPQKTVSIAILMEDPDAPINSWTHWLVWNLPPAHQIKENTYLGRNGINDFSRNFYCGPCPMKGSHHYVFKIYALDVLLKLSSSTRKHEFERNLSGHVLAYGELTGIYERNK